MRKWLVWLVAPALLAGACSGDNAPASDEDPKGALVSAFEETGTAEEQTVTLTIASTPESLVAASTDQPLTPEQAEMILGSSLSIGATKAEEPEDQTAVVRLEVPGTEGAEVLFVEGDLYARADIRGFVEAVGQDPAAIDAFLASPTAQQFPFLEAGANGEFLQIEGTEELAGGSAAGELTSQQQQIINEFREALNEEADVSFEGEEDVGDHFVVSISAQALYQRFAEFSAQLGTTGLPGASVPPTEDVPEGDVTVDVWVSDGRLAQLELDLIALGEEFEPEEVPEGVDELAIRLAFEYEVEDVSAPEDAVTVTGEDIVGLIFGGAFGGELPTDLPTETTVTPEPGASPSLDTPSGEEVIDCSLYEGLPPETFQGLPQDVIQQLEEICPGIVPNQ